MHFCMQMTLCLCKRMILLHEISVGVYRCSELCGFTQIGIVMDILSAAAAVVSAALLSKQKNHRCIFNTLYSMTATLHYNNC